MSVNYREQVDVLAQLVGWTGQGTDVNWGDVENSLGLPVPGDYKELVRRFPHGDFQGYMGFSIPKNYGDGFELIGGLGIVLEDFRLWREEEPDRFPYPLHPEPGGIIPWGSSIKGETFFWLPVDPDPDSWEIVACEQGTMSWERFSMSATQFITGIVASTLRHEIIAGGRAGPPRFEPLPKPDKMTNGSADSYEADSFVPSLQPLSNELASIMTIIGEHGPRGYAPISWDHAEQRLSVRLPIDYKQCIDTLGAGSFRDLHVVAPDCPVPDFDLFALIDRISEGGGAISYEPADRPENPEFAIQGLIPWGWTDDGLTFFWKAEEKPADEWLIFLSQPDFISFRLMAVGQKKLSTTGVIARYLLDPLSIVERLIDSRTRTVVDPRVPPELPLFSPTL